MVAAVKLVADQKNQKHASDARFWANLPCFGYKFNVEAAVDKFNAMCDAIIAACHDPTGDGTACRKRDIEEHANGTIAEPQKQPRI